MAMHHFALALLGLTGSALATDNNLKPGWVSLYSGGEPPAHSNYETNTAAFWSMLHPGKTLTHITTSSDIHHRPTSNPYTDTPKSMGLPGLDHLPFEPLVPGILKHGHKGKDKDHKKKHKHKGHKKGHNRKHHDVATPNKIGHNIADVVHDVAKHHKAHKGHKDGGKHHKAGKHKAHDKDKVHKKAHKKGQKKHHGGKKHEGKKHDGKKHGNKKHGHKKHDGKKHGHKKHDG